MLLHLGSLAQMVRADEHAPCPSTGEVCCHDHSSPASAATDSHGCPDDADCPVEGEHCHHHGACAMHGMFLLFPSERAILFSLPEGSYLSFEILDDRPGDGPVMKLDKPPLI